MEKEQWVKLLGEAERTLYAPVEGGTPIDGMAKEPAKRKIYKQIEKLIKGFFRDTGWKHVHNVWKAFDKMGLDWNLTDNEYYKNDVVPAGKIWRFEIRHKNNRGKDAKIGGYLTAAGAGSVKDPLDKYDITVVMY